MSTSKAKKTVTVTFRQDTPSYASITLEVGEDDSNEAILEKARKAADSVGDVLFEPSFAWFNQRIDVIQDDESGEILAENVPLEKE